MIKFWQYFKLSHIINLYEKIEEKYIFEDALKFSVLPQYKIEKINNKLKDDLQVFFY